MGAVHLFWITGNHVICLKAKICNMSDEKPFSLFSFRSGW